MKFKFTKPYTGLDIDGSSLRMVQIVREKKGWRLISRRTVQLPPETLEFSYKDENIISPRVFTRALEEALLGMSGRVDTIGLSLPIESMKIMTHKFEGLQQDAKNKIRDLIAWKEKETLPYPVDKAMISFYSFSPKTMEGKIYLAAIGYMDIIRDFELNIRQLKLDPKVIRPAVINQFNFYMNNFKATGITAFLGLFNNYFSFFVFHEDQLIFYRGKRKPASYIHFMQEIDMTIELFQGEYPGKDIERLALGRQLASSNSVDTEFESYPEMEISLIDEESIIIPDEAVAGNGREIDVSSYASAIGAAQSLTD
ncbi:MAG: hypothetical protein JW944_12960 [Deltaproteobacteria bacterium]|nr:hypothetical protein [Deltaproteobacteria bacterium]